MAEPVVYAEVRELRPMELWKPLHRALEDLERSAGKDPAVQRFLEAGRKFLRVASPYRLPHPQLLDSRLTELVQAEMEFVDKHPSLHAWFLKRFAAHAGIDVHELVQTYASEVKTFARLVEEMREEFSEKTRRRAGKVNTALRVLVPTTSALLLVTLINGLSFLPFVPGDPHNKAVMQSLALKTLFSYVALGVPTAILRKKMRELQEAERRLEHVRRKMAYAMKGAEILPEFAKKVMEGKATEADLREYAKAVRSTLQHFLLEWPPPEREEKKEEGPTLEDLQGYIF